MNENQMNQLIDAIKDLKGNDSLEIIATIVIPLIVLITTIVITIWINKKQHELQLKQQQIALKKEIKVRALSEIRSSMVEYTRQLALLTLELKKFSDKRIDVKILGNNLVVIEEECRKIGMTLNANKCLITDFNINYDILKETLQYTSHSIYFNYYYPEIEIPEILKKYVINNKDPEKLIDKINKAILYADDIFTKLEEEIQKTIASII